MGRPVAQRVAPVEQHVTALVDTSVLIDYLRGHEAAADVLESERASGPLQARSVGQ